MQADAFRLDLPTLNRKIVNEKPLSSREKIVTVNQMHTQFHRKSQKPSRADNQRLRCSIKPLFQLTQVKNNQERIIKSHKSRHTVAG
jgi:hypothetical protein